MTLKQFQAAISAMPLEQAYNYTREKLTQAWDRSDFKAMDFYKSRLAELDSKLHAAHLPQSQSTPNIEFIEMTLSNDEASTNEELVTHFQTELGLAEADARTWVAKRGEYLARVS